MFLLFIQKFKKKKILHSSVGVSKANAPFKKFPLISDFKSSSKVLPYLIFIFVFIYIFKLIHFKSTQN